LKYLLFIGLLLGVNVEILAQHLKFDWQNCLENQYADCDIEPCDIISTGDGYLIVSGYQNPDYAIPPGLNQLDIWLTKTDLWGGVQWSKFIWGTRDDSPVRIISSADSGYFILGTSVSGDQDITFDPYPDAPNFWIIKIDKYGNILWDKIVGGSTVDFAKSATPTSDGGIIALGETQSNDGDITVHYGSWDIWAVKLNGNGTVEWNFTFGSSGAEIAGGIISTSDGGYLICGYGVDINSDGNITCTPHSYWPEVLICKLDADGQLQWQNCFGGSEHDIFLDLLELDDGYVFCGSASSDDGDLSGLNYHLGYNHVGSRTSDLWIVKTDFSGNISWQNCLGGSENECCNRILHTSTNELVMFGTTESRDGDVIGTHSIYPDVHYSDIWMLKTSNSGQYLGQRCIGSRSDERFRNGVILINDSTYILTSQFFLGSDGDIACGTNPNNSCKFKLWVTQFRGSISTFGIREHLDPLFNIYPNPANKYLVVENQKLYNGTLSIFNILGEVERVYKIENQKTSIALNNLQDGVYYYLITVGKQSKPGKLLIMH